MLISELNMFLTSCNHEEQWLKKAEVRLTQQGKFADCIFGHISQLRSEGTNDAFILALVELINHHFDVRSKRNANIPTLGI